MTRSARADAICLAIREHFLTQAVPEVDPKGRIVVVVAGRGQNDSIAYSLKPGLFRKRQLSDDFVVYAAVRAYGVRA